MTEDGRTGSAGSLRFGVYAVDTARGALTKNGVRLKIQPHPLRVLECLIAHAPAIVSREDLRRHVWGDDVNVDSEQSLNYCIRQIRQVLDDSSTTPRFVETLPRLGYRFIASCDARPDANDAESGRRANQAPAWRMPARLVELVGRADELAEIASRLARARLVTLVGPGGVGKTQLALEVARRLETTVASGARLIDLAPATSAADVERLVADVMLVPARTDAGLDESIGPILRDAHAILVFDNCERVAEAAGRLVESVLAAAPGVRVLATSQRPLGAAGEVLVRVAPLACSRTDAAGITSPAVQLFEQRAAAVQGDFDAAGRHAAAVFQICNRLEGLPLAIELAAAQVRVLGPSQILERLDSRFDPVAETGPAALDRHRTLGAMFEWSASLLSPDEERLLEHLSVFPGIWDLDAAVAILGPAGDWTTTLTPLTGLIDKSLVFADTSRQSARYRLLDSVRLFARERLRRAGQYEAACDRMLTYYAGLAARADREWYTPNVRDWMERLREERPNFRAAFEWSLDRPAMAERGLELAAGLRWHWCAAGDYAEGREWIERALRTAADASAVTRARAEIHLGQTAHFSGDFDAARVRLERGLSWFDETSAADWGWAWSIKALNEAMSGNESACADAARAALMLAARTGHVWTSALAELALGQSRAMRHDHAAAAERMTTAYEHALASGDWFLQHYVTINLGLQRLLADDLAGSREMFVESLSLSRRLSNFRATAGCFEGLGYLAVMNGSATFGARLMGAAARMRDISGMPLLPHWHQAHDAYWGRAETELGSAIATGERAAGAAAPVDELAATLLR